MLFILMSLCSNDVCNTWREISVNICLEGSCLAVAGPSGNSWFEIFAYGCSVLWTTLFSCSKLWGKSVLFQHRREKMSLVKAAMVEKWDWMCSKRHFVLFQTLVDFFSEKNCPVTERLKMFYTCRAPPLWDLQVN